MRRNTWALGFVLIVACDGGAVGGDAGRVVDIDAASSCGTPGSAPVAGRCRCMSDCAEGACFPEETSFLAGGFCNRSCATEACGPGYVCTGTTPYCAQTCAGPTDCGPSRVCDAGICRAFCFEDSDCNSGNCNVWSGICLPPGQEPVGAGIGQSCLRDEDCRSDLCGRAGICLGSCSIARQTCPEGAVCVGTSTDPSEDWGQCLLACESDGTCRQPWGECIDLVVPVGSSACLVGSGCVAAEASAADAAACGCDRDCATGDCLEEYAYGYGGGFCNRACTDDPECLDGYRCIGGSCLDACASTSECRPGYVCDIVCRPICQRDSDCLLGNQCNLYTGLCQGPVAGGGIGATCATDGDCQSGYCNTGGWPEGFCVSSCSVSAQLCPEDALCRTPLNGSDRGTCAPLCATDADCAQASADCVRQGTSELHCW